MVRRVRNLSVDLENIPTLRADMDAACRALKLRDSGSFYAGAYIAMGLHSLYRATSKREYVEEFRRWLEVAKPTASIETDAPGSLCGLGSPKSSYGASGTYDQFITCPDIKGQRQWAFGCLHFLWYLLKEGKVKEAWVKDSARWIQRNIVERLCCNYGLLGFEFFKMVESAEEGEYKNNPLLMGYWGSQVALGIGCSALDQAIADILHEPKDYRRWLKPRRWYRDWTICVDNEGLWDIENPNINNGRGWGMVGEHKAPATGHAGRYAWLAKIAVDLWGERTGLARMEKVVPKIILPEDYVTPDGNHRGKVAGTVQIANYIDGDNSGFRLSMRGMKNAAGSNAGMEGWMITGWQYPSSRTRKGKRAIEGLLREVLGPQVSVTDKRYTGTYARHDTFYGRIGLLGAYAECQ